MAAAHPSAGVLTPAAARTGYAGVVSRGVALAIDAAIVEGSLLLTAGMLALIGSLVGGVHLGTVGRLLAAGAWLAATAAYFVVGWSTCGQTPGMRAMELSVETADERRPGIGRAIARAIALGLCIAPMFAGFLPVLFDRRRRGLHDMLAGTVVVHRDGRP